MHEHRCRAFAYTIQGNRQYGDVKLTDGSLAVEDAGSKHFPDTAETSFTVFTLLVGDLSEPILLRSQNPLTLEVYELAVDYLIDLVNA